MLVRALWNTQGWEGQQQPGEMNKDVTWVVEKLHDGKFEAWLQKKMKLRQKKPDIIYKECNSGNREWSQSRPGNLSILSNK